MKVVAGFLLAAILSLTMIVQVRAEDRDVTWASVIVENACSGTMRSALIVQTASHCVGALRQPREIHFRDGSTAIGISIWDSAFLPQDARQGSNAGLDLAFLVLDTPWPYWAELADRSPVIGETVYSIGNSAGIQWWPAEITFKGQFRMERLGDVMVYRGDLLPGASGSCVYFEGTCIGLITHGIFSYLQPPLIIGAGWERLAWAWQDLLENGLMYLCPHGGICRSK